MKFYAEVYSIEHKFELVSGEDLTMNIESILRIKS